MQVSNGFLQKIFSRNNQSELTVNLEEQTITINETGETENFEIGAYKKTCLLNGYDDIDYLISIKDDIEEFEKHTA